MTFYNKSPKKVQIGDNLVDLYNRIPDYSEVKHLSASDFINRLEILKEEYREARASLVDDNSDIEYITQRTETCLKINNTEEKPASYEPFKRDKKFLSISSCKLYHSSFPKGSSQSHSFQNWLEPILKRNALGNCSSSNKEDSAFHEEEDYENFEKESPTISVTYSDNGGDDDDFGDQLSKWSSDPFLIKKRKEYSPPQNVENRYRF